MQEHNIYLVIGPLFDFPARGMSYSDNAILRQPVLKSAQNQQDLMEFNLKLIVVKGFGLTQYHVIIKQHLAF